MVRPRRNNHIQRLPPHHTLRTTNPRTQLPRRPPLNMEQVLLHRWPIRNVRPAAGREQRRGALACYMGSGESRSAVFLEFMSYKGVNINLLRTSRVRCNVRRPRTSPFPPSFFLLPTPRRILQWPYSYDACDVGTAPNQTLNGLPLAALTSGDQTYFNGSLSYLPGQRLSRCTCAGESHPGPKHSDGTFVGRSAPEIDVFEAAVGVVVFFYQVIAGLNCLVGL